jgi:hypothetical protein
MSGFGIYRPNLSVEVMDDGPINRNGERCDAKLAHGSLRNESLDLRCCDALLAAVVADGLNKPAEHGSAADGA